MTIRYITQCAVGGAPLLHCVFCARVGCSAQTCSALVRLVAGCGDLRASCRAAVRLRRQLRCSWGFPRASRYLAYTSIAATVRMDIQTACQGMDIDLGLGQDPCKSIFIP